MKLIKFISIFLLLILCIGCTKKTAINEIVTEKEEIFNSDNSTLYVIPANGLNLRSEPNTTSERITLLSQNTELTVLERSEIEEVIDELHDYWYKVDNGEEVGWVFGGYLAKYPIVIKSNEKKVPKYIYDLEIKMFPNEEIFYAEAAIEYYNNDILTVYENSIKNNDYFITDTEIIYLYQIEDMPDWFYSISNKAEPLGYIFIYDISLESYYGDYEENKKKGKLNKEYELIKQYNNINRYGPLLLIEHNGKKNQFLNSFNGLRGGLYQLINYFPMHNEMLAIEQYYEDSNTFIYNLNRNSVEAENIAYHHLYFNEARTYLFSLGWSYGGSIFPEVKIYKIENSFYNLIYDDTIYGIYSGAIINNISWKNNNELLVDCTTGTAQVIVDKEEVKIINNLKYDNDRFEY